MINLKGIVRQVERMVLSYLIIAILLDWMLGDPYFFPHPVVLMGKLISLEERLAFKYCKNSRAEYIAGTLMVFINCFLAVAVPGLILYLLKGRAYQVFFIYSIYQAISARMLHYEASQVKKATERSLEEGRKRLSYIVGRQTSQLDESEIYKATIETVAENTSDGIIAPLFYIFILGPLGGYLYKTINTMDSMIGYRTEKYEYLGKVAAQVDDVMNYIPARITGLLMGIMAIFYGRYHETMASIKKYKYAHLSPNAGYPEAAIAGILNVSLGGGHYYFGQYIYKPMIGDSKKEISPSDIDRTIRVMYGTEVLFILFYSILTILLIKM